MTIAVDMGRKVTKTNKQTICQSTGLGISSLQMVKSYNEVDRTKFLMVDYLTIQIMRGSRRFCQRGGGGGGGQIR